MSGTTTTPGAAPAATAEPTWAKPSVSVYALTIFVVAFVIAKLSNDNSALLLMYGAAISMANQVMSYWIGSSSGSTRKTELGTSTTTVAAPGGSTTTMTTGSPPTPQPTGATP